MRKRFGWLTQIAFVILAVRLEPVLSVIFLQSVKELESFLRIAFEKWEAVRLGKNFADFGMVLEMGKRGFKDKSFSQKRIFHSPLACP